ncbi:MAG: ferritin family protein [Candidatus Riflebacteria bacterium]|nr:ferritin family protein [Candidatus Riflebacteria bacterium]
MNIFELAKNQEKQAEETYRKLAAVAATEGLRTIFTRLAETESRHFEIIQKMEKAEKVEISDSDILSYAEEAINKMNFGREQFKMATSQNETYKAALAQEAEAEKFYREHAEKSTDEHQQRVFLALSNEEHKHYIVLENIIEFINFPTNHPENAEFHALEER